MQVKPKLYIASGQSGQRKLSLGHAGHTRQDHIRPSVKKM